MSAIFCYYHFFLIDFLLVSLTDKQSANKKKFAKDKLNYDLNIAIYLYTIKHSNITKHIFKSIKLKERDNSKKKKRYKTIFDGFFFLVTRLSQKTQTKVRVGLLTSFFL